MRKGYGEEDFMGTDLKESLADIIEILTDENKGNHPNNAADEAARESAQETSTAPLESAVAIMLKLKADVHLLSNEEADPEGKLPRWLEYAETVVRERISLIVEPSSEVGLVQAFEDLPVAKFTCVGTNHVVVLYDVKQAGESSSRPAYRAPAMRKAHLRKLLGGLLHVRSQRATIPLNDVYVMVTAGKLGNENDVMSSFLNAEGKMLPKEKRAIFIHYEEQSMADRRDRTRGSLDVVEFCYFVSQKPLPMDDRKHKHYPGGVRSNSLGPVPLPDPESQWRLSVEQKKNCTVWVGSFS
jgi:hypothetical protein